MPPLILVGARVVSLSPITANGRAAMCGNALDVPKLLAQINSTAPTSKDNLVDEIEARIQNHEARQIGASSNPAG